ncbi:hypothetical protein NDU88_008089 [Pleurodeles waltl]|uniref:RNase H type-1 domain-containing protein n=1 Tax=Pleurodeles waltl TaxID=8319 RepID=A0AAV7VUG6_PLEWA|nr:hypothetical protein NDU88_008089 [Pleurodeles waltl]
MLGAVDLQAMAPAPEPSEMESSPFKTAPPFERLTEEEQQNAWFTDGTARYYQGKRQWQTVTFQPATETMLLRERDNESSQLAELQGVTAVIEQAPIRQKTFMYTDSRATYQGLVSWVQTWRKDGLKIKGTPIWGGEQLWEEMIPLPLVCPGGGRCGRLPQIPGMKEKKETGVSSLLTKLGSCVSGVAVYMDAPAVGVLSVSFLSVGSLSFLFSPSRTRKSLQLLRRGVPSLPGERNAVSGKPAEEWRILGNEDAVSVTRLQSPSHDRDCSRTEEDEGGNRER